MQQCKKVEDREKGNTEHYEKGREMTRIRNIGTGSSTRARHGEMPVERKVILKRWEEYII